MQSDEMWLCGDVHGDLRTLRRALWDRSPPKAIVLVGDLDPPELVVRGWKLQSVTMSIHGSSTAITRQTP